MKAQTQTKQKNVELAIEIEIIVWLVQTLGVCKLRIS